MIEIVLDVETTGLEPMTSCIWSIAAVPIVDGVVQEAETWSSLVMPLAPHFTSAHQAVVRKVSGLSDSELLALFDAPHRAQVADSLGEWLRERSPARLLAYNADFDRKFLMRDPWKRALGEIPWACVMEPAARAAGWERIGLQKAIERAQIPWPEGAAHDARVDAIAAARLWVALGAGS